MVLKDVTNTPRSTTFWNNTKTEEYAKWWKPSGVVPLLSKTDYNWPTHIVYDFPRDITKDPRVTQIQDAPDPPPEPYPRAKKQKITRQKGMFGSKRITPDNHLLVCRKVRAFPTSAQRRVLQLWFDGARQTYNWSLGVFIRQRHRQQKQNMNRIALKKRFVTCKESCVPKSKRWIREVPYTIREGATNELSKAISDRFGDSKRLDKPFTPPKFRSKFDDIKSINIDTQNFCKKPGKRWQFYVTLFPGCLRIRGRDQRRILDAHPEGPSRSVRLSMTRTGKVYMHVPIYVPRKPLNDDAKGHLVSLDPGSNPFMTYYSPTRQSTGSFGTLPDVERFRGMQRAVDKLNSITDRNNGTAAWITERKRSSLRIRGIRIREKARNLAKDATAKVTDFLTSNFQYIHASPFELSRMCLRLDDTIMNSTPRKRLIRKQTVRDLQGWLHYPFKETLKHKMEKIVGLVVEFASEAHTTKTCDSCGAEKENVGGAKKFTCDSCGHSVHRDVHGARNHALRNCVGRYLLI